jgi:GNAT superfamily N-acetyltransferase
MESVVIRQARESDRTGVEALCAHIWDGDDYLPFVFTDWLADPGGEFYVATLGGQVIGTGKLSRFADDEWWLEGLRVHPDFQGRGIGRLLFRHGVRQAEASARQGISRFVTGHSNPATRKLAMEAGFSLAGHYVRYVAEAVNNAQDAAAFRLLGEPDFPAVWAFLDSSPHFVQVQRSVKDIWLTWRILTPDRLRTRLTDSLIYGWHGRRRTPDVLDGVIILNPLPEESGTAGEPRELDVAYIDAITGSLAVIAHAARALAAALDYPAAQHYLLARPERLVAVEQAGWRRPDESEGISLYSRQFGAADDSLTNS